MGRTSRSDHNSDGQTRTVFGFSATFVSLHLTVTKTTHHIQATTIKATKHAPTLRLSSGTSIGKFGNLILNMYHSYLPLTFSISLLLHLRVQAISYPAAPATLTACDASSYSANCAGIESACPFAQTACVNTWCYGAPMTFGSCDTMGCCNKENITEVQKCLVSERLQDPCLQMEGSAVVCSFSASCLCHNSLGQYDPDGWDGIAQSCAAFAGPTRHPNISSLLTGPHGALGLCTRVYGPANSTATTTSALPFVTSSASPARASLKVIGQCSSSSSSGTSVSQFEVILKTC